MDEMGRYDGRLRWKGNIGSKLLGYGDKLYLHVHHYIQVKHGYN